MKQIFYKIASIILALTVLLSSFSFTINKHLCGGKVVNTTLFVTADSCNMVMSVCEYNNSKKTTNFQNEPCCKDTSKLIQGNDNNQQAKEFQLKIPTLEFLITFIYTSLNNFKETTSLKYVIYKPPLVLKNIQTFFQIFLI